MFRGLVGFIHAEPDAVVTLDGFGDMLKSFLALDTTQAMLHPKSNYKRWLFDWADNYSFASVYNNMGERLAFQEHHVTDI